MPEKNLHFVKVNLEQDPEYHDYIVEFLSDSHVSMRRRFPTYSAATRAAKKWLRNRYW